MEVIGSKRDLERLKNLLGLKQPVSKAEHQFDFIEVSLQNPLADVGSDKMSTKSEIYSLKIAMDEESATKAQEKAALHAARYIYNPPEGMTREMQLENILKLAGIYFGDQQAMMLGGEKTGPFFGPKKTTPYIYLVYPECETSIERRIIENLQLPGEQLSREEFDHHPSIGAPEHARIKDMHQYQGSFIIPIPLDESFESRLVHIFTRELEKADIPLPKYEIPPPGSTRQIPPKSGGHGHGANDR